MIYSVRQANNAVSAIVEKALKGIPQLITKRNKGRVVVVPEAVIEDMLSQLSAPASFADMFPVTETEPPLGEIKMSRRPGRARVRL
jgi:prevent-host-death family protein